LAILVARLVGLHIATATLNGTNQLIFSTGDKNREDPAETASGNTDQEPSESAAE
jgi:hypothetical protein